MSENNFVVQWEEFTPRWFVEGIDNVIDNIYVDIFAGIPMYDPDGTESVSLLAGGAVYQKGTNKICVAKSNITLTPPDSVPSSSNNNFYVYTIKEYIDTKAPKASPEFTGSISLGRKSGSTIGTNSLAVGEDVVASGANSHAEGESLPEIGAVPAAYTTASGQGSHAEGGGTTASGLYSHAEGERSSATAEASHAEGQSHATGILSHAEGASTASGLNAHAEGSNTEAGGSFSHAENRGNFAIGDCSHAEGYGTHVKRYAQHTFGTYNVVDETGADKSAKGKYIEIVGNGEGVNAKSNARTLDWNGNERIMGDLYTGCNADSTGGTKLGDALDLKAPKSSPVFTGSLSRGRKANTTVGAGSFAFGNNVTASAMLAHAEGAETEATASFAHSEGELTKASGQSSHAEGANTTASGATSHAEGFETIANHASQHVFGEYNVEDTSSAESTERGNYVEIVGNGEYNAPRSNARTLDWDGNERLKGDLYFGCNADSTGGTKLGDALALKAPLASPVLTGTPKSVTPTSSSNEKMIATKEYVDNAFTTFDAMLYKGVVNQNSDLPATHKRGWTYKVGTAGTYVGIVCEVGDMIICNTAGTSANNSHWDVVQTNIDGAVIGPASSTTNHVALFNGATGKVIKDGGTIQSLIIDDTAGNGNTDKTWSADKIYDQLELKAPKASPEFTGSISLGRKSGTTSGSESVAVGYDVEASGTASTALGWSTKASTDAAHAEGYGTQAIASAAHAEGYGTKAAGEASHSEGYGCFAEGAYSHAEGNGTLANHRSQHVFGENNFMDSSLELATARGDYVEIVGNGTGNNKSNARALDWNGNERLKGNLYVGCSADSTGGSKVLAVSDFASSLEVSAIISEYGT